MLGECLWSLAIRTLFSFSRPQELQARRSRAGVPGVPSSGDGGAAATSLMPGVGGIQPGRRTMESETEDGDASGGLSQDSALFSGSRIPAISVIISKYEKS